jgi:hypothetical protein
MRRGNKRRDERLTKAGEVDLESESQVRVSWWWSQVFTSRFDGQKNQWCQSFLRLISFSSMKSKWGGHHWCPRCVYQSTWLPK